MTGDDMVVYDEMLIEHGEKKTAADLVLSGIKFSGLESEINCFLAGFIALVAEANKSIYLRIQDAVKHLSSNAWRVIGGNVKMLARILRPHNRDTDPPAAGAYVGASSECLMTFL